MSGQEQKSTEEVEPFSLETWKKVKDEQEGTRGEKAHLLCVCYHFPCSLASRLYRALRQMCLFLPSLPRLPSPPPVCTLAVHSFYQQTPLRMGQLHCLGVTIQELSFFLPDLPRFPPLPVRSGDNSAKFAALMESCTRFRFILCTRSRIFSGVWETIAI